MRYTLDYERLTDRELAVHEKSIAYMRWLSVLHANEGRTFSAADQFLARWPRSTYGDLVRKAAVTAGTTDDATWAGPLAALSPLADGFLAYARPSTLLGRIPGLREVPFNVSVALQTGAGVYAWVGQGDPKPITSLAFSSTTLGIAKALGIIVVTSELLKLATPGTEAALRQELADGLAAFLDQQFVDPAAAPVAGVSPGSITNGVTPIAPTGTTAAALVKDVGALISQFTTNNPNTTAGALLMRPQEASMLVGATNSQTLTTNGGSYAGLNIVVSGNVGTRIVALDAASILYADDGVVLDSSKNATLQMDSAPTDPPTAATVLVSLWQQNLVGVRAERFINWKKAKATAVSLVSPTAYVPGT